MVLQNLHFHNEHFQDQHFYFCVGPVAIDRGQVKRWKGFSRNLQKEVGQLVIPVDWMMIRYMWYLVGEA